MFNKTIVAVIGAVLTWGYTAQSDGITSEEWWGLAIAVATAAGVYQVKNADPERGAVDPGSCALGLLLGLLIGYLLWKNGI